MSQTRVIGGSQSDAAAIEALHSRDMAASKAQDFEALLGLMSEDAIVLAPGAQPMRTRAALEASFRARAAQSSAVEVTDYRFEWEEVRVLGDYAFEWGAIIGASRPANTDAEPQAVAYNVMRILRKENGDWRVHRTIWNARG